MLIDVIVERCAALDVHKDTVMACIRRWDMDGVELLLCNAHHVKNVPGRKTDVGDATWLAQLLECGLLRGSFVPPPAIARLRDLTRYRKKLIEDRTGETQRILGRRRARRPPRRSRSADEDDGAPA